MPNIPSYDGFVHSVDLARHPDGLYMHCILRRRLVRATPEEFVRQYVLKHLLASGYARALMSAERKLAKRNRVDIIAYDPQAKPYLLVECKRADQDLSIDHLFQLIRYHSQFPVRYIALSNGVRTHCIHCVQPLKAPMDHFPDPPPKE